MKTSFENSFVYCINKIRYQEKSYFLFPVIVLYIIQTNGTKVSTKANIPTVKEGIPVKTSTSSIKSITQNP